jgi:hypothetical protein
VADLLLPHNDGVDLARALKEERPDSESGVILITPVQAEVGWLAYPSLAWLHNLADAIVVCPYHADLKRAGPVPPRQLSGAGDY